MWRARRGTNPDWVGLAATYAAAIAVRLPIAHVPFWIDEAAVYHVARTFGGAESEVFMEDAGDPSGGIGWLFWQRPLHAFLMWPAAAMGADAFRIWSVLLASALPPLVIFFLRGRHVRPVPAYAVGYLLAIMPWFVVFGVYGFPDTPMLIAMVGALAARDRGRPALAGTLVLAAVWLKELAYLFVLALVADVLWRAWKRLRRQASWSPDAFDLLVVLSAIVGLWPLLYALSMGAPFPGWFRGGSMAFVVDRSFIIPWLAPVVAAGLLMPRSWWLAGMALLYPVFFAAYQSQGRGVAMSYFLASMVFTLIATAVTLDEGWTRHAGGRVRKSAAAVLAVVLVAGILVFALVPQSHPTKSMIVAPLSAYPEPSLHEWMHIVRTQGTDFEEATDFLHAHPGSDVFLVDGQWHDPYHPAFASVRQMRLGFTAYADQFQGYLHRVTPVLENMTDFTVLLKNQNAANLAIRSVYEDCIRFENPTVVIIEGPACSGREAKLQQAHAANRQDDSGPR